MKVLCFKGLPPSLDIWEEWMQDMFKTEGKQTINIFLTQRINQRAKLESLFVTQ
jgi:hypothetical protein